MAIAEGTQTSPGENQSELESCHRLRKACKILWEERPAADNSDHSDSRQLPRLRMAEVGNRHMKAVGNRGRTAEARMTTLAAGLMDEVRIARCSPAEGHTSSPPCRLLF